MNFVECTKSSVGVNLMKNTKRGRIYSFSQKEDGIYDKQFINTKQAYLEWNYPNLLTGIKSIKRYKIRGR